MDALVSSKAHPEHGAGGLWLAWVAATCAGVVAMTLLVTAARPLQGYLVLLRVFLVVAQVPGMLVLSGAAQQRALRFGRAAPTGWFRRTALGVLVGMPVSVGLALLVAILISQVERIRVARTWPPDVVPGDASPGGLFALMGFVMLGGVLVSAALPQWRGLRRASRWSGWWLAISVLGWAIAFLAASKLLFPEGDYGEALFRYMTDDVTSMEHVPGRARMLAAPVVLGLLAGAITGAGLVCILWARPPGVDRDVDLPSSADASAADSVTEAL